MLAAMVRVDLSMVAVVVLGVGCGAGVASRGSAGDLADQTHAAAEALVAAIGAQDVAAIQARLGAPLSVTGLLFTDDACARQFPAAAVLAAGQLPAFAACLAKLPLRASVRRDPMFGIAILEHAPGIEVAARFTATVGGRPRLTSIGFAGARDAAALHVTLSPAGLAALRTDTSDSALPPQAAELLETERTLLGSERAYAWLEVCLSDSGALQTVAPIEASSPAAVEAFSAVVRTWTFRGFDPGTGPRPACARVLLEHPGDTARAFELLPFPVPAQVGPLRVASDVLARVTGERTIEPDDLDKRRIQDSEVSAIAGSFWVCIDGTGKVARVDPIESTGITGFDAKIRAALQTWTYKPYAPAGEPLEACTAVSFLYQQS